MEPGAYARSGNAKGEWQTVQKHLLETAEMAACHAEAFGAADVAKVAGLFHDFGKYAELFQQVLHGQANHVDHALPGAALVLSIRQRLACMYTDAALVIAAHHAGLKSGDPHTVEEYGKLCAQPGATHDGRAISITGSDMFNRFRAKFREETGYAPKHLIDHAFSSGSDPELAHMLFDRMLLSALVDADYSSAAHHDDEEYLRKAAGASLQPEAMLGRLLSHVEAVRRASTADAKVNAVRDELFRACVDGAAASPGLFTLTAPTGTGKTLSLLAFALAHAARNKLRRVILVLPFLSILDQNAKQYRDILGDDVVLEDHSQAMQSDESRLLAERWSAPVIVTTSVKFFETLFRNMPTELRKLHHVAQSVVVFDEAQSLPTSLARVTLQSVNQLVEQYGCSVLFSTATQPAFDLLPNLNWQPRELVRDPQSMYDRTRRVSVEWRCGAPTHLAQIAEEMAENPCCCAILNLTKHASTLFALLKKRSPESTVFHISSRMCTAHRKAVIEQIRQRLKAGLECRLVSTQCLEAGVDLDFAAMYRALAPLYAVIQAAGRCNRNGVRGMGRVVVFIPDEDRLYPDSTYKNAANKLLLLLKEGDVDIQCLSDMRAYDKLVFADDLREPEDLRKAIDILDFEETSREYHLIDQKGINILVPYLSEDAGALFQSLKRQGLDDGIDHKWMKLAQPLTITAYLSRKQILRNCPFLEMLAYRPTRRGAKPDMDSNWYVLNDPKAYDADVGFAPELGSLDWAY